MEVGYFAAALGGLISFLSPCVLPLVPAYLCFIAGTSLDELTREDAEGKPLASEGLTLRVALGATGFVLGFTTIFVALGASASAINPLIIQHKELLSRIAGAVIIVFGLHYMGLFRIAFLNRDARFHIAGNGEGERSLPMQFASPYLLGLAFAFGWTPCIGPILGAILTASAASATVPEGVALLAVYSAGLGIPFLLAAAFTDHLTRRLRTIGQIGRRLHQVAGLVMVAMGIAMMTGQLSALSYWLLDAFPALGRIG